MEKRITNYEEAVQFLLDIPKFTSKNSMETTKDFLTCFPIDYEKVKFIHVAGTNGKGSTCAYMKGILEEAGYKCGFFTSPHLVDMRERFIIDNKMVSKEQFLKAFGVVMERLILFQKKNKEYFPTFFEYLFFMGMVLFCEENILDYVILETGLGGRLDATNAISQKALCVITKLGLDHTQYLGDTIEQIAIEKCGIITENTPVVFWNSDSKINDVITNYVKDKKSFAVSVSKKDYIFLENDNKSIDFLYKSSYYEDTYLKLCTTARYQLQNCVLAIKAVEILLGKDKMLTQKVIKEAVFKVQWAGRMEEIAPRIYLDGAHNLDGVEAFVETINEDQCKGKRYLVFSVVSDKNYKEMFSLILESGLFDQIIFTKIQNDRGITKEQILELIPKEFEELIVWSESSQQAIKVAQHNQGEDDYIYVAGSLYLIGEVREIFQLLKDVDTQ